MDHRRHAVAVAHPHRTLAIAFAAWKVFLVAIVVGSCVAGAYDTSAALAVAGSEGDQTRIGKLLTRFASWDAIYFVSAARRGYRFEQEWAFGTGLPVTIRGIIKVLVWFGLVSEGPSPGQFGGQGSAHLETLVGILVANAAHLFSVFILYRLGLILWRGHPRGALLSLVAALLSVVSPAGVFLSAPYAESSYAFLSFTGYLLYARSCQSAKPVVSDGYLVLAGVSFGLATAFRSNGILNGLPFAWEVFILLPRLASTLSPLTTKTDRDRASATTAPSMFVMMRRLLALGLGGVAVASGSLIPQAVAYQRFCAAPLGDGAEALGVPRRSWCDGYLPSIYTFVQAHYWNNGFLRYWTLSNLPLFLLAAPVLAILVLSGVDILSSGTVRGGQQTEKGPAVMGPGRLDGLIRSAAAAQILLALVVVVNSHVQIITRISSGSPMWYFWLAGCVVDGQKWGRRAVMFMVMYASVQGVLFALFLPPA